ncbi:MAG: bifunctional diaminohydroxyphosphoribosylaminopyrimidine deaminase/5-amino-6-(5-phosphoribosylamino)uracil reductase RibD [Candidatus Obscuribacterales bacterium]|jgi:diaminohydroxyphosphoribosylaminopyrimidine deaminase/5-amino-6-(5-phosphoribosylamino)uracil reductase|nr:bifunctional diaminohydroxyphosphoribosylaminopyrimidine deaminase/5-amino-6-(5-phosphoribosylamino)uracil reductase RibD [Candidatus Obscuribacterales bacterium]
MPEGQELDQHYMRRCIELARKAEGRSSPNPLVGAVVLDQQGNFAGEGFHPKAGQPHAEVFALDQAGENARGGTLYVNLEPCCHFGKTPPCADRVIASGISRVVYGLQDPNPKVLGGGLDKLRQANIQVDGPLLEAECAKLNRAFIKRITKGMPWVALKIASTLDGRIADRYSKSQWITGAESRKYVHELRNRFDCVFVGTNTVIQDNPSLTVRDINDSRNPHRAIPDAQLKIRTDSKIFVENPGVRTFLFTTEENLLRVRSGDNKSYPANVELVPVTLVDGKVHIEECLKHLSLSGILTVLCEGGGRLAASLLEQNLVDELFWFCAPKLLVDQSALNSLSGSAPRTMESIIELEQPKYIQLGQDLLIHVEELTPGR